MHCGNEINNRHANWSGDLSNTGNPATHIDFLDDVGAKNIICVNSICIASKVCMVAVHQMVMSLNLHEI